MTSKLYNLIVGGASVSAGAYFTTWLLTGENPTQLQTVQAEGAKKTGRLRTLPPRSTQIQSLHSEEFDVLIIGGGATGAGCAIDSVTRGLKTALVELDDFASGTSSRSTKLIHGGVRYLQKAILNLDLEQYKMVKEALHERSSMLKTAPHLTHAIPIMLPVYEWWKVPYYWVGIKAYDLVAGSKTVKSSYYLSKNEALEIFPMLKKNKLVGAIVYHDGQQDDARMCLALALTATRYGATVANHVKAINILKDENGKICGAHLRDELTGKEWDVKAKCIINAAGPFTDSVRKMDDSNTKEICTPSKGVHIVLPGYYSPEQMGLLDPETSDGRVIFFLPWQKHTLSGTTDSPCDVTYHPTPTEEEISFILNEIKNYLNSDVEVRRGDVLSAWGGIRPLVSDPNKGDTQSLARNHIVHVSKSNLVTIAGGKWTTYRSMAQETIDAAIKAVPELKPTKPECQTDGLQLEGSHGWTPTMYIRLVQDFGLECEVAQHLATSYGDRAFAVAKLANLTGKRWPVIGNKIHPEFPYIDAEIRYGVREYAVTAVDMIARRLRLAFLNVQAAQEALPTIVNIMAEELNWSDDEKKKQLEMAHNFLATEMGMSVNRASRDKIPITLSQEEIKMYVKRFQILDHDHKGYVSINDIRRSMKNTGENVTGDELHEILREIDTNMNGQVELDEYLQMMSALKSGHISHSRFARMAELEEVHNKVQSKISVERSGGGF
ncbi:glycerol-3-phosphate dehydrogenase, mitochondrial [Aphis gossypii]|uniref:Glycerol-3-phosphate dehydrogenase n=1 Tax=Aphis gossypii TaxID=80765 RepID=A0A0C5QEU0_APHGO|nr:glycerol-3-phosphate dehydrogenase, mitochondrial [Aphis gossypii]AJQ30112.1 glycerol-3-phosphate dehydrogenase isoform 5 [Aphis gossypii]